MEDHRHRRQPLLPLPSSAPETLSLKATPPSVPATEGDDLVTPQSIGEDAVDGEKSSAAAAAAAGRMKKLSVKSKSGPKTAWRKLLSQCSQVCLAKYSPRLLHWVVTQNWLPSNSVIEKNPAFFNTRDIVILKIISGFPILTKEKLREQVIFDTHLGDWIVAFGNWEFDPLKLSNPFGHNISKVHVWQGYEVKCSDEGGDGAEDGRPKDAVHDEGRKNDGTLKLKREFSNKLAVDLHFVKREEKERLMAVGRDCC
ncbi:uncharacterized protein DS421_12g383760 [Arachis hypogaea]|nr:uncharacterized protein DS421_12g383760 [Arachis hypogaea]